MQIIGQGNKRYSSAAMLLLSSLRFYKRFISPLLIPACRFTPSCSEYAFDAVSRFGAGKGVRLSIKRLCRCNPFCKGGYDPVE